MHVAYNTPINFIQDMRKGYEKAGNCAHTYAPGP